MISTLRLGVDAVHFRDGVAVSESSPPSPDECPAWAAAAAAAAPTALAGVVSVVAGDRPPITAVVHSLSAPKLSPLGHRLSPMTSAVAAAGLNESWPPFETNAKVRFSTEPILTTVSEPAHLVAHQRTQHSIVVRPTVVRAISTDIIRQTIVQHCRTWNSLPPAVLNCDSLSTFKSRLKTHMFSTAFC